MFEIKDGVMLTDEPRRIIHTVGKIVILFDSQKYGEVSLVRRNKFDGSVCWQISPKTDWRDLMCVVNSGIFSTRASLIDFLHSDWPDDFIWLLFHLEIFDGKWNG